MQQQLRSGVVVAVFVFFLCHFWLHLKKEEDEENGDEKEMKKRHFWSLQKMHSTRCNNESSASFLPRPFSSAAFSDGQNF